MLGFPLSAYSRVEKAQLLILKDESLTVAEARQDFATTVGIAAAVFALLVGVVAVLAVLNGACQRRDQSCGRGPAVSKERRTQRRDPRTKGLSKIR